jgi:hypothetical protein
MTRVGIGYEGTVGRWRVCLLSADIPAKLGVPE